MTVNIIKRFNATVMDHFDHSRCVGDIASPTGEGMAGSTRSGVFMKIQVRIDHDRIADAGFKTFGCVPAIACGSFVADWSLGRSVSEVRALTPDVVLDGLDGLPRDRCFCASLAVEALKSAITNSEVASSVTMEES